MSNTCFQEHPWRLGKTQWMVDGILVLMKRKTADNVMQRQAKMQAQTQAKRLTRNAQRAKQHGTWGHSKRTLKEKRNRRIEIYSWTGSIKSKNVILEIEKENITSMKREKQLFHEKKRNLK